MELQKNARSVMFKDEDGVEYGIKHVGNKPRVSCMPYLYDIAEGNISGHLALNKFGHNSAVPATLETIWDGSAVYTWPTTAATVNAAANLADVGATLYDGTATGGSTTTLEDTGVDFTAGSVVAVGDIVLDDDNVEFGVVTTVAATVLTFSQGKDTAFALGTNYRVAESNGTGAAVIEVQGLDANYAPASEFIVLNGASSVASTVAYLRIFRAKVLLAGSTGWNVGNVTLTGAALVAQITAEMNQTLMALWTVPAGYSAWLTSFYASTSTAKVSEVHLYVRPYRQVFQIKHVLLINAGTAHHKYDLPIQIEAHSDIQVVGKAVGGGGEMSAGFDLWYED